MAEELTIDIDDDARSRHQKQSTHSSRSRSEYEIISTAKEVLAADGKGQLEEVALYLEELKVSE